MKGVSALARAALVVASFIGLCGYTAPNHQFHIDMGATASSWTVDNEIANDKDTFVLFKFAPAGGSGGATGERTIIWQKLPDIIASSDAFAFNLASSFLAQRYPKGYFNIATKVKARSADGQAYYVFTAKGLYKDIPAQWTGVVVYFPAQGAALAGDVHSLNGQDVRDRLGITDSEIVTWGSSLRPGE
jgi:hypothetical protein